MRLFIFIKLTFIFISGLFCVQASAHTDSVLGEGLAHYLYHGLVVLLVVLIIANVIGWWREKRREQ